MILPVNLEKESYDIVIKRGALNQAGEYLNLNRKVLILTDSGVPSSYAEKVKEQCKNGYIYTILQGEGSKNLDNYRLILAKMVKEGFARTDCLLSLGGGVCGDLGGFVASSYMRGIDFYNIPTTLLSQLDSSIGGKVAVDFEGVKNIVGAFYQPKRVIIDSDTLKTLDKRQLISGLCEGIKMALTCDEELFELIEKEENFEDNIDEIILKSLKIKAHVVEKDPKEKNLRKILNFGHTIGHAIEAYENGRLLHGECVALGMIYFSSSAVKERLRGILSRLNISFDEKYEYKALLPYIIRDKKSKGEKITVIFVKEIGSFEMKDLDICEMEEYVRGER